MPVPLWTPSNKTEAKYNVVTEFPKLGLHAAAASGDVGLVEYALHHGQPINSVLDGVLPIHAASAGGHPQVVKKLIEHGADVNAPRLSRRYFNDKNRDASAPIVGTSGSTPLHFAAANGNTDVITILLLHGAHPDRADKYGVTPEALARENNWLECAQILHDWVLNKDRDLRDREVVSARDGNGAASTLTPLSNTIPSNTNSPEPESPSFRRRLHVKQSIDTALNRLKTSHSDVSLKPLNGSSYVSKGSPPPSPFGEYSFDPTSNGVLKPEEMSGHRRPSLPHILSPATTPQEASVRKKPTATKLRRPCSAGTGAERGDRLRDAEVAPYGKGGSSRKLGSKISLLNMFKKGQLGDVSEPQSSPQVNETRCIRPSASSVTLPSTPKHFPTGNRASPNSAFDSPESVQRERSQTIDVADASHDRRLRPSASFFELDSSGPPSPGGSKAHFTSAVDLHNAIAQQHHKRNRSRSNATNTSGYTEYDSDEEAVGPMTKVTRPDASYRQRSNSSGRPFAAFASASESKTSLFSTPEEGDRGLPPTGILRHRRTTSSSTQSQTLPTRALRFDQANSGREGNASTPGDSPPLSSRPSCPSLNPPRVNDKPLSSDAYLLSDTNSKDHTQSGEQAPSSDGIVGTQRGFASSPSQSTVNASRSLSPIMASDGLPLQNLPSGKKDPSFSHQETPPIPDDKFPPETQLQIPAADRRMRGDSVSSTWTADSSKMPQYGHSGSTLGSPASPILSTPAAESSLTLPNTQKVACDEPPFLHLDNGEDAKASGLSLPSHDYGTLNERRAHSPLDIDIKAISSHAQAQALVEKTRQDILEVAGGSDGPDSAQYGSMPLSARLAAYGESLALQRKLKEQEHAEKVAQSTPSNSPTRKSYDVLMTPPSPSFHRSGIERQLSLDKSKRPRPRAKTQDPRRPSTADGLSRPSPGSFFPAESFRTHQMSLSASPPSISDELEPESPSIGRDHLSPHQRFLTPMTPSKSLISVPEPLATPTPPRVFPDDREEDELQITRLDSTCSADTEVEPTSPPRMSKSASSAMVRSKPRSSSSAKKLNRMGFTVVEQASPSQRSAQPNSSGKLFGGLKSIMQTLKGK